MKLNAPPEPPAEPAAAVPPLSAQVCHGLAVISVIFAIIGAVFTLLSLFESPAGFVGAGWCAISALFWWVIGDVVAGTNRKS